MPTMAQISELASKMYVGNPTIGATEYKSGIQFDSNSSTAKSLGLTPTFYLWSGEEANNGNANLRSFGFSKSGWDGFAHPRSHSHIQAVCLGD